MKQLLLHVRPDQTTLALALDVVDQELDHHGLGDRQGEFDAEAALMPAGPVAQGGGIAAGGVGRGRFSEQLANRIGSPLRQLLRQHQLGGRR